MIIYEQRIIEGDNVIETLNSWGKDGWELCHYERTHRLQEVVDEAGLHVDIIYYSDCIVKKYL